MTWYSAIGILVCGLIALYLALEAISTASRIWQKHQDAKAWSMRKKDDK